jgi:hypothetical protein
MKFLPGTKNSRMCLRRKMWRPCLSIDHIIAPSLGITKKNCAKNKLFDEYEKEL